MWIEIAEMTALNLHWDGLVGNPGSVTCNEMGKAGVLVAPAGLILFECNQYRIWSFLIDVVVSASWVELMIDGVARGMSAEHNK
jgi:hypothetical protein